MRVIWPPSFISLFQTFLRVKFPKEIDQRWWISIAATIWTIWLSRNEATFEDKTCRMSDIEFIIKLRSMHWIKASSRDKKNNLETIWWSNPKVSAYHSPTTHGTPNPDKDSSTLNLQFIFDSSSRSTSYGGFLTNMNGKSIAVVSGHVSQPDPGIAQLSALSIISKKLLPWLLNKKPDLSITSNSSTLIECMEEANPHPEVLNHKKFLLSTLNSCKSVSWFLRQHTNSVILALAQEASASTNTCSII